MNEKTIIIKEGELKRFVVDGNFIIKVKDGRAYFIPESCLGGENGLESYYEHDCDKCVYLGCDEEDLSHERISKGEAGKRYDLYFCKQGAIPTVIVRYGDNGEDYLSGLGVPNKFLRNAEHIAKDWGLL